MLQVLLWPHLIQDKHLDLHQSPPKRAGAALCCQQTRNTFQADSSFGGASQTERQWLFDIQQKTSERKQLLDWRACQLYQQHPVQNSSARRWRHQEHRTFSRQHPRLPKSGGVRHTPHQVGLTPTEAQQLWAWRAGTAAPYVGGLGRVVACSKWLGLYEHVQKVQAWLLMASA